MWIWLGYIAKFEDNDPRGLYEIQEASGTG